MSEKIDQGHKKPTTLDLLQQLRGETSNDKYRSDLANEFPAKLAPTNEQELMVRQAERVLCEAEFKHAWDEHSLELAKEHLPEQVDQEELSQSAARILVKSLL